MKTFIPIVLLSALASFVGGCGKSEPQGGGSATPKIALVMKSLANEFFSTMADGAKSSNAS